MTDLAGFLLARLAEDETVARIHEGKVIAQHLRDLAERVANVYGDPDPPEGDIGMVDALWFAVQDAAEWIARHDPARMLAEVAAKRQIVEHCAGMLRESVEWDEPTQATDAKHTLRLLAQPYADHPDFDPTWKVEP